MIPFARLNRSFTPASRMTGRLSVMKVTKDSMISGSRSASCGIPEMIPFASSVSISTPLSSTAGSCSVIKPRNPSMITGSCANI